MNFFSGILLFALLSFCVNGALAADIPGHIDQPEDVVTMLYRDFGWEIKSAQSSKKLLIDQPMTVLKRYFAPKLAELIAKDRKYKIRTKEIGHLDFVLICGSQDPDGIENIKITKKTGTNVVSVTYDQNGEKSVMKIDYHTTKAQNGWRISDVYYKARESTAFPEPIPEFSLVKLLSQPY